MPDKRTEILGAGGPGKIIGKFCEYIDKGYFPISDAYIDPDEHWGEDEITFGGFLHRDCPIVVAGLGYSEWENIGDFRVGMQMLTAFTETQYDEETPGPRAVLFDNFARWLPKGIVDRLPLGGYPHEILWEAVKGTKHEALGWMAKMWWQDTHLYYLDIGYEELAENYGGFDWSSDNVKVTAQEYKAAKRIQAKIDKYIEWMVPCSKKDGHALDYREEEAIKSINTRAISEIIELLARKGLTKDAKFKEKKSA